MNEFWNKFKWYVIGGGALLVVGAVALVVVLVTSGPEEGPMMAAPDNGGAGNGDSARIERVDSQSFEGDGNGTVDFRGGGGLTILSVSHNGGPLQNFIVWLDGEDRKLLANELGNYEGSRAVGLEIGDYTLDITAGGSWTVQIDQSIPSEAPAPPKTLEGSGPQASDYFYLAAGEVSFTISHDSDAPFYAFLMKASDGEDLGALVSRAIPDEQRAFSGFEVTRSVPQEGIYLINVEGGMRERPLGEWEIEVSQ